MVNYLMKKEEIKPDKRNYRIHNDKNKQLIKKSLDELGAGRSIVIDNDGEIIGGNGVFEAWGDKPIRFIGSINEDLNASVYEGQRGKVFFTINDVSINQKDTQQNKGGLTDVYLDLGTYVKSFYSVIVAPNCVKISAMGNKDLRIHHKVIWNKCCPKIISERWKK